jgi:hypothetical protein
VPIDGKMPAVPLADVTLLAVPGHRWSTASSTQPVDTYRGGG